MLPKYQIFLQFYRFFFNIVTGNMEHSDGSSHFPNRYSYSVSIFSFCLFPSIAYGLSHFTILLLCFVISVRIQFIDLHLLLYIIFLYLCSAVCFPFPSYVSTTSSYSAFHTCVPLYSLYLYFISFCQIYIYLSTLMSPGTY